MREFDNYSELFAKFIYRPIANRLIQNCCYIYNIIGLNIFRGRKCCEVTLTFLFLSIWCHDILVRYYFDIGNISSSSFFFDLCMTMIIWMCILLHCSSLSISFHSIVCVIEYACLMIFRIFFYYRSLSFVIVYVGVIFLLMASLFV